MNSKTQDRDPFQDHVNLFLDDPSLYNFQQQSSTLQQLLQVLQLQLLATLTQQLLQFRLSRIFCNFARVGDRG